MCGGSFAHYNIRCILKFTLIPRVWRSTNLSPCTAHQLSGRWISFLCGLSAANAPTVPATVHCSWTNGRHRWGTVYNADRSPRWLPKLPGKFISGYITVIFKVLNLYSLGKRKQVGVLREEFTCLGICCCIFFFPLGNLEIIPSLIYLTWWLQPVFVYRRSYLPIHHDSESMQQLLCPLLKAPKITANKREDMGVSSFCIIKGPRQHLGKSWNSTNSYTNIKTENNFYFLFLPYQINRNCYEIWFEIQSVTDVLMSTLCRTLSRANVGARDVKLKSRLATVSYAYHLFYLLTSLG